MKTLIVMSLFSVLFGGKINHDYLDNQIDISLSYFKSEYEAYQDELKKNYFNGESKEEIAVKIEKNLKGVLEGKGMYITEQCLNVGLDPYLFTAVMLQETGCYWRCSYLTRVCNNVAGNKGNPGCNGGSYRKFDTLNDGIIFAINKLNSYYKKGLTTAKEINPYYAEDKTWYIKVNNYINKLKS
ncbi:MAG: hypothetical protein ACI33S_00545 [Bacilli bacterium]